MNSKLTEKRNVQAAMVFVSKQGIYKATVDKLNAVPSRTTQGTEVLSVLLKTDNGEYISHRMSLSDDAAWAIDALATACGIAVGDEYAITDLIGKTCYVAVTARPPAGVRVQRFMQTAPAIEADVADEEGDL